MPRLMFGAVDALLDAAVGSVFPAAQLVVIDRSSLSHERAVGACTPATLFDLASLTKPLATVALVMQLVEAGRLRLDDEARPGVTARHLLAHASGLPGWKLLAPAPGAADARAGITLAVRREPLESKPGEVSRYSDLGFILLGDLVERAAGARIDRLFDERIAKPLGVGIGYGPRPPEACAPTEGELRGVVHDENARAMGGVAPHAGLFGHAHDVATLALAHLAGWADSNAAPRLPNVSRETLRTFFSPSGVPGSTWRLGWDGPAQSGSSAGDLWPKSGVGHLAFTGCSMWLDPPRGRAVVLLSNRVHPTRSNERIKEFRPRLHDAIAAALDG